MSVSSWLYLTTGGEVSQSARSYQKPLDPSLLPNYVSIYSPTACLCEVRSNNPIYTHLLYNDRLVVAGRAAFALVSMALARLCLRSSPLVSRASPQLLNAAATAGVQPGRREDSRVLSAPLSCYSSTSSAASPSGKEEEKGAPDAHDQGGSSTQVAVSQQEHGRSSNLPSRRRGRRHGLMRRDPWDIAPFGLSRGLTNALMMMTENLNKLLELPSRLLGLMKEDDNKYEVRLDVPGLTKEELQIVVENGFLVITGEHKEEEGSDDDDGAWRSSKYRYYNTSLALPGDAKMEDIKAELKHGVLRIVIPRDENKKRDAKEVLIH